MHDLKVAIEVRILDCTFLLFHTYAISRDSSASPTLSKVVQDFPGQLCKMHVFANMRSFTFQNMCCLLIHYSVYNEQLKCVMNSFRSYYNDPSKGNEQCTIQEVNGYLKDELGMYYEVSRALLPEAFRYLYTALDFTDCAGEYNSQVKINKKNQRKIVNIFLPIILAYVLGAQKNRLIAHAKNKLYAKY